MNKAPSALHLVTEGGSRAEPREDGFKRRLKIVLPELLGSRGTCLLEGVHRELGHCSSFSVRRTGLFVVRRHHLAQNPQLIFRSDRDRSVAGVFRSQLDCVVSNVETLHGCLLAQQRYDDVPALRQLPPPNHDEVPVVDAARRRNGRQEPLESARHRTGAMPPAPTTGSALTATAAIW